MWDYEELQILLHTNMWTFVRPSFQSAISYSQKTSSQIFCLVKTQIRDGSSFSPVSPPSHTEETVWKQTFVCCQFSVSRPAIKAIFKVKLFYLTTVTSEHFCIVRQRPHNIIERNPTTGLKNTSRKREKHPSVFSWPLVAVYVLVSASCDEFKSREASGSLETPLS